MPSLRDMLGGVFSSSTRRRPPTPLPWDEEQEQWEQQHQQEAEGSDEGEAPAAARAVPVRLQTSNNLARWYVARPVVLPNSRCVPLLL